MKMTKIQYKIKFPKIKIKVNAQKVYPELKDLEITPTVEEQNFKPQDFNTYGFKEIKCKAVNLRLEEKTLIPTKEDQPFTVSEGYDAIIGGIVKGVPTIDNNAEFITEATGNRSIAYFFKKIPKLTLTGATSLSSFLNGANNLEEIDVSGIDTSNVTTMQYAFYNCEHLQRLDLSSWDFSKVTSMYQMFAGMTRLTELILPDDMDSSKVENFTSLFQYCNFTSIDISKLKTSKATTMFAMFNTCRNLKEIDISNFSFENTNGVDMAQIFYNCPELETISEFDCSKTTRFVNAFMASKLKNLGGLKNAGQAYSPAQPASYSNYGIMFQNARNLTHESIINVFNDLFDLTSIGVQPQVLDIGNYNVQKCTAEEIAIATNKGWIVR
jgi:surface protein